MAVLSASCEIGIVAAQLSNRLWKRRLGVRGVKVVRGVMGIKGNISPISSLLTPLSNSKSDEFFSSLFAIKVSVRVYL